ncbi:MAG: hypothetical protein HYX68_20635 [Planctomycetes bacterium]|nr:hypothetical protein [Planctomycetota bacterium]
MLTIEIGYQPSMVAFTPDSKKIAVQGKPGDIELFSIQAQKKQRTFDKNAEGANCCCFSPDGNWIAIGGGGQPRNGKMSPGRVRVFEVKTGKVVAELD